MNVARLNFSHGTYADHAKLLKTIRSASDRSGVLVSILQDLQGPRIRLGDLPSEGVDIKKGEKVIFTTGKTQGALPVTYSKLHNEIKEGERILIADGVYEFIVEKVSGKNIQCKATTKAHLTSHKGMNFPDSKLKISSLSDKDIADLEFGIKHKVDFVALSFVRSADDVKRLKALIAQFEKKHKVRESVAPAIIVKIEKPEAVENFDAILEVTDGVMIARGDLGIELPAQNVPLLQKELIAKCNAAGKPVIVATQMLESMISNPRPTRAEISDVSNAVIDHTDAVMLSGETAMGAYPVQAVQYMAATIEMTEKSSYDDVQYSKDILQRVAGDEAVAAFAAIMSQRVHADALMVATESGTTARLVSKYRPELPVYATTNSDRIARQLNLSWGIVPLKVTGKSIEEIAARAQARLKKKKLLKHKDQVIVVFGKSRNHREGQLQSIEVITI
jgi:pyruvate kinase